MSENEIPESMANESTEAEVSTTSAALGINTEEQSSNEVLQNLASQANLDFLLDVPLQVTVELGRCRISIAELLKLGKGAVLELDKVAGEPLDFRVNDRLVARGEAIVINDKFGVRLTDIVSPSERVEQLK